MINRRAFLGLIVAIPALPRLISEIEIIKPAIMFDSSWDYLTIDMWNRDLEPVEIEALSLTIGG